ncbi:MAG TPA: type I-MYXAN CRISPR-associated protein Cas6/Cmx6 [Chloroflexota bacterium]
MQSLVVDVAFPVRGTTIPADHAYSLFASLSRLIPAIHADLRIGIHGVSGSHEPGRRLKLTSMSKLRLRLPIDLLEIVLPLVGRELSIDGHEISIGPPQIFQLRPAASVQSRMVVIAGFTEPEAFKISLAQQLESLAIEGHAELLRVGSSASIEGRRSRKPGQYVRRTLRVKDREIVGFPAVVSELTADESIRLQECGLGGRRHYGCGIFAPALR